MKNRYFLSKNFAYYKYKNICFCFNSLTGNYLILNRATYNWIKKIATKPRKKEIQLSKTENEVLKLLLSNNLLVFGRNKDGALEKISKKKKNYKLRLITKKPIIFLGFCITDNCNFKCSYCIKDKCASWQKNITKNILKWGIAKKRLDEFFEIILRNKTKSITIAFGGGEPLLQFCLIKKIVNYTNLKIAKKIKINFDITTNGSLINKEVAEFLFLNKFNIGVSLDGFKSANDLTRKYTNNLGTFDDVLVGLKLLTEKINKRKITISVVVSSKNIALIKNDFLKFIKEMGIKKVCIEPDIVHLINCEYKELIKKIVNLYRYGTKIGLEIKGHWKKAFKNILSKKPIAACLPFSGEAVTIDTFGKIKPCIYSNDYILTGKLKNIFSKKNYLNFLEKMWVGNIKECKDCILEGICLGGCYLSRIAKNSKVFQYRCLLFKDMTKFLIKDFLKNNYKYIKKQLN